MSPTSGTTGKSERSLFEKPRGILFRAAFFAVSPSRVPPRAAKGFNWACAKLLFWCADSRFAKPRISLWEGFNFVSAKLMFGCADSRFAKPRSFPERETDWYFLRCAKSDKPFSLAGSFEVLQTSNLTQRQQLRTNQIKSFAAPSPPTWSPCSRPFAILPVSAVSDAQNV